MSNGLDDYAGNPEMRTKLREPFSPSLISKLPATNKRPALDYVSHAVVTDRLNREAPGWTYELTRFVEVEVNGLPHLMAVYGYMRIGDVVRWEVGEADGLAEYGRELKGCISDFIRRAAMRFGVALDLWSKEDLHASPAATDTRVPSPTVPSVSPGASAARPGQPADDGGSDRAGGEADAVAATPPLGVDGSTATDGQWADLIDTVGGSKAKAREAVNDANGTHYTAATIRYATADEVAAAMAKVVLAS